MSDSAILAMTMLHRLLHLARREVGDEPLVLIFIYGPAVVFGLLMPPLVRFLKDEKFPIFYLVFVPCVLLCGLWAAILNALIFGAPITPKFDLLALGLLGFEIALVDIIAAFFIRRTVSPQFSWRIVL